MVDVERLIVITNAAAWSKLSILFIQTSGRGQRLSFPLKGYSTLPSRPD
jgi:hypothetical protein